ncbi:MAG: glycine cleavage T C-terminal barrel domain-containing protein [Pseudomonadota bacterium]
MIFPAPDAGAFEPKPTALFAATASVSVANSWTSINGWSAPRVYTSVEEEYAALTSEAAIADFGPLYRYVVRGAAASDFLVRVTTAPVRNLELGESARGLILNADGYVTDLIDVARLGADMLLLTCAKPHARRLQLAGRGMQVSIEDITGRVAALAIIGPKARDAAATAGVDAAGDDLAAQTVVRGIETAARPINVGVQPGVEIIYPYAEALILWERVRRAAAPIAAGVDAIDILRIESGTPRTGVDFVGADDIAKPDALRTPEALGLPHLAPLNRAWFNGRRALVKNAVAADRELAVLAINADDAHVGASVLSGGTPVGRLTSAAFSPRLRRVVAFADLAAGADKKPLEVSTMTTDSGRVPAEIFETAEMSRATAFRAAQKEATDSRR